MQREVWAEHRERNAGGEGRRQREVVPLSERMTALGQSRRGRGRVAGQGTICGRIGGGDDGEERDQEERTEGGIAGERA